MALHKSQPGMPLHLRGSVVALPTPFRDGTLDEQCLAQLCERQVVRGTTALVVCGSTGEATALRPEEYAQVVRSTVIAAASRVPVIAGCGALSTADAAHMAEIAAQSGVAGLLCAPPPYVRPTPDGLIGHFEVIQQATEFPVLLYDVPGRTGIIVSDETVVRLQQRKLIIGIKDATADLGRPPRLRALCGEHFIQLTGDDATAASYRAAGGHGCVSVTANVAPALCSRMHRAWDEADLQVFGDVRDQLAAMSDLLFVESNPVPLKAALAAMGLIRDELRLPLTCASRTTQDRLAGPLAILAGSEERLATGFHYALAG